MENYNHSLRNENKKIQTSICVYSTMYLRNEENPSLGRKGQSVPDPIAERHSL